MQGVILVLCIDLALVLKEPEAVGYLYQPAFSMDYLMREPPEKYCPQPGDIFVCTDKGFFAKLGHWAARAWGPHHSGIVVVDGEGRLVLLEGGPHNTLHIRLCDLYSELTSYAEHERVWIRKRSVPLTPEQSACLTAFAHSKDGARFALIRMLGQLTPFRSRGPWRTIYMGGPHENRFRFYCSELVMEACVAAGLFDSASARPSASYPRDLFFGRSHNRFIDGNLDMSEWQPPARWSASPGQEIDSIKRFPRLDGDTPPKVPFSRD
jgi:hypothetical protein